MATIKSIRCDKLEDILNAIIQAENDGSKSFEVSKHCDHYTISYYLPEKKYKWNGQCKCGHLHDDHRPISSVNYSAGRCTIGEWRCAHFIHNSTT